MAHSGWTPEPWERSGQDGTLLIKVLASGGMNPVADANVATRPGSECLANARRIVACVNACRGIPTEALEAGVARDMLRALKVARAAIMYSAPERVLHPAERKALDLINAALRKARGEEVG